MTNIIKEIKFILLYPKKKNYHPVQFGFKNNLKFMRIIFRYLNKKTATNTVPIFDDNKHFMKKKKT